MCKMLGFGGVNSFVSEVGASSGVKVGLVGSVVVVVSILGSSYALASCMVSPMVCSFLAPSCGVSWDSSNSICNGLVCCSCCVVVVWGSSRATLLSFRCPGVAREIHSRSWPRNARSIHSWGAEWFPAPYPRPTPSPPFSVQLHMPPIQAWTGCCHLRKLLVVALFQHSDVRRGLGSGFDVLGTVPQACQVLAR